MSLFITSPTRPGSIIWWTFFYLHSRFIRTRCENVMKIMKAVPLTALPVVTNTKCDVSAYISTNVISITDWSNLFESDLFYSWYSTCN